MSFFSKSKSKGNYPRHNNGSEHYQKTSKTGILGKIINSILGSKGHYISHSNPNKDASRNHRKKSWS